MKRWSLFFLVVGLLVGVVAGLLLDQGVSAQRASVQGTVMYVSSVGTFSSLVVQKEPCCPRKLRMGYKTPHRPNWLYCRTLG